MTIRSRTLAALTAAGAAAALAAPAAHAAPVTRSFDIRTAAALTPGYAHMYGNVTFISKTKATITGRINDVCPEDGLGAYVNITAFYGSSESQDNYVAKDTQGCKDQNGSAFSFTLNSFLGISSVRFILREQDADGHKPGDADHWLSIPNPKY
jgi:opacity protein-like surface antigen